MPAYSPAGKITKSIGIMPGISYIETETEEYYRISEAKYKEMMVFYKHHRHFIATGDQSAGYNYYWFDTIYNWCFVELFLHAKYPGVLNVNKQIVLCIKKTFVEYHDQIYKDVVETQIEQILEWYNEYEKESNRK